MPFAIEEKLPPDPGVAENRTLPPEPFWILDNVPEDQLVAQDETESSGLPSVSISAYRASSSRLDVHGEINPQNSRSCAMMCASISIETLSISENSWPRSNDASFPPLPGGFKGPTSAGMGARMWPRRSAQRKEEGIQNCAERSPGVAFPSRSTSAVDDEWDANARNRKIIN